MARIPTELRWFLRSLFGGFLLHRSALPRRISTGFTSDLSSPRSFRRIDSGAKEKTRALYPRPERRGFTAQLGKNRSEEHTSELQSRFDLVCRLLLEKKKQKIT